jgi:hypothetical protein
MGANVYASYALLTRCRVGAYRLFCKLLSCKELTDGVGFEPTVRYERTHTFQARLANAANEHRRSITAVTETLLRSLRSETRPKTPVSRIQTVYSAPTRTRNLRLSEQGSRDLERAVRNELRHRPPFAFEVQEWR